MENYNRIYCDLSENGTSSNLEAWQSGMYPIFEERENIGGRLMIINQGDKRLYFRVQDSMRPERGSCVIRAEVRYFDEGVGHFCIVYNTESGICSTPPVLVENTKKWRTAVLVLEDALLNREICANDFALELNTQEYGCSNCHVVFGSLNASVFKKRAAQIEVSADSLAGYTFFEKEKISFDIQLKNDSDKPNKYQLKAVFETDTDDVLQTESFDIALDEGEKLSVKAAPDISKYGCYRMRLECTSADGEEYSHKNINFALSMNASKRQNDFLGGCVHFTHRDSTAVAPLMAASGFGAIRDEFLWRDYEKEKGVFEFLPEWERYLGDAERNGLKMLTILGFGNPLYGGETDMPTGGALEHFDNYVRQLVSFLGDRCNLYEMWNEPNLVGFSKDQSPENYIPALKVASEAIRSINSRARIAAPGLSGESLPWIERFLQLGGGEYIDYISFHPYLWIKGPDDGEYIGKLNGVKTLINKYCPELKMIVSEMGWASNSCTFSRKIQAEFQAKVLAISAAVPEMEQYYMYEYQDSGISLSDLERNFGAVEYWEAETPYAAKPSFLSFAAYNCLTEGKRPKCLRSDDDLYLFVFETDNANLLMLWSPRETERRIDISDFNVDAVYDINGNETDGELVISSSPIYIKCGREKATTLTQFIMEKGGRSKC